MTNGRPDTRGDGDGWVECDQGHRHWGLFGAAGLLLHRSDDDGDHVLLQHRAEWSHFGGTWGLLGGARHNHEPAVAGALREATEEGGVAPDQAHVHGRYDEAHGGWTYATILAEATADVVAQPTGGESIDVVWHGADAVDDLDLHPGFAGTWPLLRSALRPLTVVVDAANVVGSRPDGWWRDRVGANTRLLDRLAPLPVTGVADAALPDTLDRTTLKHWWPRVRVVVEGAARPVAASTAAAAHPGVTVVAAAGSGDDAIVEEAGSHDGPVLVITADRELRARCAQLGAASAGPSWLQEALGG